MTKELAIAILSGDTLGTTEQTHEAVKMAVEALQERKTRKWITVDKGLIVTLYKCSECGRMAIDDSGYDVCRDYPYCHCGAKMEEIA